MRISKYVRHQINTDIKNFDRQQNKMENTTKIKSKLN